MTEYDVTVIERDGDKPDLKETTSGGSKTTAAWLRAKADEIDPPKPKQPVMRGPVEQR